MIYMYIYIRVYKFKEKTIEYCILFSEIFTCKFYEQIILLILFFCTMQQTIFTTVAAQPYGRELNMLLSRLKTTSLLRMCLALTFLMLVSYILVDTSGNNNIFFHGVIIIACCLLFCSTVIIFRGQYRSLVWIIGWGGGRCPVFSIPCLPYKQITMYFVGPQPQHF